MTTSAASAPANLPIAAVEAARKAAGAKAADTRRARIAAGLVTPGTGAGAKAAATRKARLEAQARQADELTAPVVVPVGARAAASVQAARRFDREAAHLAQVAARLDQINRMREAARLVNLLGLRADGTINRNPNSKKRHLMVTRDNCDSIIARAARSRSLAS